MFDLIIIKKNTKKKKCIITKIFVSLSGIKEMHSTYDSLLLLRRYTIIYLIKYV